MDHEQERKVVQTQLDLPSLWITSYNQRAWINMGDRMAVAIIKALYGKELSDLNLQKVLHLSRQAFVNVRLVDPESDRVPAVTLCLLEWLIPKRPDREAEIRATIQQIQEACERSRALPTAPVTPPALPQP